MALRLATRRFGRRETGSQDLTTHQTILVADDEAALRELLVVALRANGFDALGAANLEQAAALLRSRKIDLLLLDLRLGDESGADLLRMARRLAGNGKTLPVLLLTGCSDRNAVLEIARLGVQGYILKREFSVQDLLARINHQLRNGNEK